MARRKKSLNFVSRGGDKLAGAINAFGLAISGMTAVDLGANVGGFSDFLLQNGAKRVYAVDTSYGVLDWRLRNDTRVIAMDRTNALHIEIPEPVDLVVVDVGWTPLGKIVPKALGLIHPEGDVVALLKPQYEAEESERKKGVVLAEYFERVVSRSIEGLKSEGIKIEGSVMSEVPGSGGNQELFLWIRKFPSKDLG